MTNLSPSLSLYTYIYIGVILVLIRSPWDGAQNHIQYLLASDSTDHQSQQNTFPAIQGLGVCCGLGTGRYKMAGIHVHLAGT